MTLSVLIEVGVAGGRCGCRNQQQILSLAEAIDNEPALYLAGLEGYEGVVHGDDPSQPLSVTGWEVTKIMDEHTFVQLPDDAQDVQIGDSLRVWCLPSMPDV